LFFLLDFGTVLNHSQDSSNRKITKYNTVITVPTSMKNNKIPQPGQFQDPIECGILLFFMDVGTVLTVWYFVVFHGCWNWPECGICLFYHTVRTFPTSMKNNKIPQSGQF
jgi:hypothetical protein